MTWKNRIVGYGESAPDQLLANEGNWRLHPRHQQESLHGVIQEIGVIQDVIVNRRTSLEWGRDQGVETLLDGHLRVTLALRDGQPSIPVKYVDLTPNEERLALATLDPISALAAADAGKLDALLREVQTDNPAVQRLLNGIALDMGVAFPEFKEYDETTANDVEYIECPSCGHKWPK